MLPVHEIFTSIDGEVNTWGQGAFTTFIRLAGCNMRFSYCDTPHALTVSESTPQMTVQEIVDKVLLSHPIQKVTITGGEPLLSPFELYALIQLLVNQGLNVSIETNGSLAPSQFLTALRVNWVFDYKLPSSGMDKIRLEDSYFLRAIPARSWVKFVIKTEEDWEIACSMACAMYNAWKDLWNDLKFFPKIAFSPCMGVEGAITPEELVKRCVASGLFFVTINCQIHKFLFPKGERFLTIL